MTWEQMRFMDEITSQNAICVLNVRQKPEVEVTFAF